MSRPQGSEIFVEDWERGISIWIGIRGVKIQEADRGLIFAKRLDWVLSRFKVGMDRCKNVLLEARLIGKTFVRTVWRIM